MWSKKNDHAPKSECPDIFDIGPKRAVWKKKLKNSSLTILLSSLVLLLVRCVEDVGCEYSHNNFYKQNERFIFVHVQCNLHVTCTFVLYIEHHLQPASYHVVEYVLISV